MQRLSDLRQYVTDLASIPRLSREEIRQLTSHLAAARQGRLSPAAAGAFGEQGQARPPCESFPAGTADQGIRATGCAGRAGHQDAPATGGRGEHGRRSRVLT